MRMLGEDRITLDNEVSSDIFQNPFIFLSRNMKNHHLEKLSVCSLWVLDAFSTKESQ